MTITSFEALQEKAKKMRKEITLLLPSGEEATVLIKNLNAMDILTLPDFPSSLLQELMDSTEEVESGADKNKNKNKNKPPQKTTTDAEMLEKIKPVVDALFNVVMLAPTVGEISEYGLEDLFPFSVKLQIFNTVFKEQSELIPFN